MVRIRARGESTAEELAASFGVSQPTISRLLKATQEQTVVNNAVRPPRYLARRELRQIAAPIPLFHVNERGKCEPLGDLVPTHAHGYALFPRKGKVTLFPGIPYFLADNAPQGFLGKTFPQRYPELRLPHRLVDWNADDSMEAICRRGEDSVGNLLAGRESFERYQSASLNPRQLISKAELPAQYIRAAREVLVADWPGSSAAGEQPKFTVSVATAPKEVGHFLVKFSPEMNGFRGRRWADLLLAESMALHLLAEHKVESVSANVRTLGNRIFLETKRFDRVNAKGRVGVISLASLQDEFLGNRANWVEAAVQLAKRKIISAEDARTIRFLYCFGGLIANSDRHPGNISFFYEPMGKAARLAPTYDMLPMQYSPGESPALDRAFQVEPPLPEALAEWQAALLLAIEFWGRVAKHKGVSVNFAKLAKENAQKLAAAI